MKKTKDLDKLFSSCCALLARSSEARLVLAFEFREDWQAISDFIGWAEAANMEVGNFCGMEKGVFYVFFMNVSVFGGLKRYQTNLDQSHSFGVKLDSSFFSHICFSPQSTRSNIKNLEIQMMKSTSTPSVGAHDIMQTHDLHLSPITA